MPKKDVKHRKGHKTHHQTVATAGKQRVAAETKEVPKGQKRAVARRQKAVEKGKKDAALAAAKAGQAKVLGELKPLAKTINAMLKTAGEFDGKANDKRLTAAITLEKARKKCREAKIGFKSWVNDHVNQGYDECRKLVAIGASADPKGAISDMRQGAAQRSRKMRAKQRASRDTAAAMSHFEVAEQALGLASDKDALSVMENKVRILGKRIVSEKDAEHAKQVERDKPSEFATVDELKKGFRTLTARDKGVFVKWAAALIGVTVSDPFQDAEVDTGIPESMRRTDGNSKPAETP
jgi:hypothetical protein